MEHECLLPCSQEPATGPFPPLVESSSQLLHLISLTSILILSFYPFIDFPSSLFLSDFTTESLYVWIFISQMHATFPTHVIIVDGFRWEIRETKTQIVTV